MNLQNFSIQLKNKYIQIVILIIVTILTYINIFQNGFAYDDEDFIVNWPLIKSAQNIPDLLMGDLPTLHRGVYRPVRSLIYVFSFKLWQLNPFGYHLQTILIHLSAVILVYLITLHLTKNKLLAFGTSLLFAVHPIHTEAVTYITASFDTIAIDLYLLAFYIYIKIERYSPKTVGFYLISFLLTLISYFIYEVAITFLPLIIIYDFIFKRIDRKNLFEKLKIYYLYTIAVVVYLVVRFWVMQIGNRADYLGLIASVGAHQARLEFWVILSKYITLLLFPYKLAITHIIPNESIEFVVNTLTRIDHTEKLLKIFVSFDFLIPFLELAILCLVTIKVFKKNKLAQFSLLWFFITLFPVTSTLPQGAILAERYLYLPSVGFLIFIVYLGYLVYQHFKNPIIKKLILSMFIIVCIIYSYLTIIRNQDWKDSVTLWKKAVSINISEPFPLGGLGGVYFRKGEYKLAAEQYKKFLSLEPTNDQMHARLALTYQNLDEVKLAILEAQKAIFLNSNNVFAHKLLAGLYQVSGNNIESIVEYQKAITLLPSPDSYHNLALIYDKQDQIELALENYKLALKLNPHHSQALNNLAVIYSKQGHTNLAIDLFEQVKQINPKDPNPFFNLGQIYESQNNTDLAIDEYQKGLQIDPNREEVKTKLANLLKNKSTVEKDY